MATTISTFSSRYLKIGPADKARLRELCNDRSSWSDGGNWIGSGKEPDCFVKESISNTLVHTYRFPTDESAFKWNKDWEDTIRYVGHFATAVVTVTVAAATDGKGKY